MLRPAAICLTLVATPALAETIVLDLEPVVTTTLDYQAVMTVERMETLSPLGEDGHMIGLASFEGVAIFDDFRAVPHRYAGTFEVIDGDTVFHGRAEFQFPDGTIRVNYDGALQPADVNAAFAANMHDAEGTGRYSGVTGGGAFEGHRIGTFHEGTHTVVRGALSLTQPAE